MGNALKGMIAGFVATLILSGLMLLNSTMDLMPQINIVRMLANLATLMPLAGAGFFGAKIGITALVGLPRSRPLHEQRSPVLCAAVSWVSRHVSLRTPGANSGPYVLRKVRTSESPRL